MMKKTRLLALLLALLMMFALLAGCGEDTGKKDDKDRDEDEEAAELEKGAYEVYDEDEDLVAYLNVSRSEIVVYDEDGEEDDTYEYEYDEDEEVYLVDDEEAFTVEEDDGDLYLITVEDEDRYLLEEIDEEDIPGFEDGDDEPAEGSGATGAATAAPAGTSAAVNYGRLDEYGTYALLEDGERIGYIDMWGDTADFYLDNSGDYETLELEIDSDVYTAYDEDGNEVTSFFVQGTGDELRICSADDPDEYYILEMISTSELPTSGADALLDLWGTYEMFDENGDSIGYIDCWETYVNVYDLDGNYEAYDVEIMDGDYYVLYEADGELFDALRLEERNGELWAETEYGLTLRLEMMDYGDLPSGGTGTGTATGAEAGGLDDWGCYEIYEAGRLMGYMDFWGSVMYLYPDAGSSENYECEVTFENGVWVLYNTETDSELTVMDEVVNGELRIYEPGDPSDYLVLNLIDYSEFPY